MSSPAVIHWLPNATETIATQRNFGPLEYLVLNSNIPGLPQGPYIYDKVIRKIAVTRTAATAGNKNIIITGIGSPVDGNNNPTQVLGPITETLITATNATTQSANIYSQIISIQTILAIDGISVGSGNAGITDYVFLDYNRTMFQTSLQVHFATGTAATANGYQSLTKPEYPDIQYGNLKPASTFSPTLITGLGPLAHVDGSATLLYPASVVWVTVTGSTTDDMYFTVLQQGIR